MKILTLSNCPLDKGQGSGYVILGYAERLAQRGHGVRVLGPPDYEPLYGWRRGIRYRQCLGMAIETFGRGRRESWDVVELYGGEAWLATYLLTRRKRRRFLVVGHSNGFESHMAESTKERRDDSRAETQGRGPHGRWSFEALAESTYRRADGVVTVSAFELEYARRRGYGRPGHVVAIENPLPDSYLGRRLELERGRVIGFCGSWLPNKGIEALTRDLPRLLRDCPGWRAVLVGVGEGFRIEEHFPEDVIPRIEVRPRAHRELELPELYESFAIHVVPSSFESFGLVAAEGMACGSALVATPVGFAASLRDGEEVVHLPHGPRLPLYESVRRLIDDEPLRRAIAHNGYRSVQRLSWQPAVERLETTYERWLSELRHEA